MCSWEKVKMSKAKITQQVKQEVKEVKKRECLLLDASRPLNLEISDTEVMKITLEEDPNMFLVNNLLMSVQFFENYERDVEILRENWFKEVLLEQHHKKCFYADALFRLSGVNVKFVPPYAANKNSDTSLHPFRIYISSENVEAAFDPSAMGHNKLHLWPQYQFTVRTNETIEKAGYISLIEFKTIEAPIKSPKNKSPKNNFIFYEADKKAENSSYFQRKSIFEERYNRKLTKTEKFVSLQNKKANLKMLEKNSLKYFAPLNEETNGFYKFIKPEARFKPIIIHDFRMNSSVTFPHEIPLECFQREDIKRKINSSRTVLNECFRSQNVLNSAAYKGYFCDLLIDKLSEALSLDQNALNESSILEEFIIVTQKGIQYCCTPVIAIRDWNNFVFINKSFQEIKTKQFAWPSDQMQKIINILPCYAVPNGYFDVTEENQDYEKTWKLVFPKAEEFLLLHMMHAHIRCYFFVLLLYKSFIEAEINSTSFGPKHLLHLLFWRVHKNFLAWPEDRPGETLLNYLKKLYKKLQNKCLRDFFITSRNLFDNSLPKDLHKAQVLIKKIIENPLSYIMRALKNLNLNVNFYPGFDISKLNTVLNTVNIYEKIKKTTKEKKQKAVIFQEDEEQIWKKIAMKKMHLKQKAEKDVEIRKEIVDLINVDQILDFKIQDFDKCSQILGMLISHFTEMASKSIKYETLSQAFLYLNQTQKLFMLSVDKGMDPNSLKATSQKINELTEICSNKLKEDLENESSISRKTLQRTSNKIKENSKNMQRNIIEELEKLKEPITKKQIYQNDEKVSFNGEIFDENEVFSVKL